MTKADFRNKLCTLLRATDVDITKPGQLRVEIHKLAILGKIDFKLQNELILLLLELVLLDDRDELLDDKNETTVQPIK